MKDVKASYGRFHATHKATHVYPSEWVVRTLLGRYPQHESDPAAYAGAAILDVGFGDGRNWPLLHNVGLRIHGVEITDEVVQLGEDRARGLAIPVTLRVGRNTEIPFEDSAFDYILASNSCYYVDAGTTFDATLREYARVLKTGGTLFATLPELGGSICEGALDRGGGHYEIRNDPWGLRNGYLFRCFREREEVVDAFSPWFEHFAVGLCRDDYYGVTIAYWLLVCRRKAPAPTA
jgi:SAM-dependent methyltransferase